jgi:hypothetical protein
MARPAPVGAARRPPATPRPGHRIAPGPPPPLSGQRDPGLVRCVSSGRLRLSRWRSPHLPAWRWNPRAPVGIGVPMQFCPVHHTPPGLSDFSHLMVQVAWQACWTAPRSHAHMILHAQLGTRQGGGGDLMLEVHLHCRDIYLHLPPGSGPADRQSPHPHNLNQWLGLAIRQPPLLITTILALGSLSWTQGGPPCRWGPCWMVLVGILPLMLNIVSTGLTGPTTAARDAPP